MQTNRKVGDWNVSAMGLGCWAIGGPFWQDNEPKGWGEVDDRESKRAIQAGIAAGINFFDTADVYGAGHSERVLASALQGKREKVVIASKFGLTFDEQSKQITGENAEPAYIEAAVEASLKRLDTEWIDLLWFHLNGYPAENAAAVADTLETLVAKGKIRKYGWSTDFPENAEVFSRYPNCAGFEFEYNVLKQSDMMPFCDDKKLAAVVRGPLAMGLLSGKYGKDSKISNTDVRSENPEWLSYFRDGKPVADWLAKFEAIREVLTENGRTPTQGALGWLWAASPLTIPIPGFRNVKQVEELAGALQFGALEPKQMDEINQLLDRH